MKSTQVFNRGAVARPCDELDLAGLSPGAHRLRLGLVHKQS